jgi:hypothetical protein
MGESVSIYLRCLLPTVFDVKLNCQGDSLEVKWNIRDVCQVKKSILRQLSDACKKWEEETSGKLRVDHKLWVTDQPVRVIDRRHHVKKPSVAELLGNEPYGEATCFMVWVPYPECVFEGLGKPEPRTKHDYMWIPTTEARELHDLEHKEPRDAARHELKHWVKERMKGIGVKIPSPDGKDKRQYWTKLNDALTPENIAKFNKEIKARMKTRQMA